MSSDQTPKWVLDILCDPVTRGELKFSPAHFSAGTRQYPIVRNIARFVSDDHYVGSFSFEWNTHKTTQLDNHRNDKSSEDQFRRKTGFSPEELNGKLLLDAGVGAGRFSEIASRWGANVVGVDLSYAVEAAYQNIGARPNVWIAQADIAALPFRHGSFDVIFSIGVLHHTPNTKEYFTKLVPFLKPGGTIVIWVYPDNEEYAIRKAWVPIVNKIPPKLFYEWCRWFVPWAQSPQRSAWAAAIRRVFPYSQEHLGMETDILDTFDGFSPRYHGIHSPESVEQWFEENGLVQVSRPSDWDTCVRGTKPS